MSNGLRESAVTRTHRCARKSINALEFVTILSAQCTERVNIVTANLFRNSNRQIFFWLSLWKNSNKTKSINFYRNKTKSIRGTCEKFLAEFNGVAPSTVEELLTLPVSRAKPQMLSLGS